VMLIALSHGLRLVAENAIVVASWMAYHSLISRLLTKT
jgi:hypothetical protein